MSAATKKSATAKKKVSAKKRPATTAARRPRVPVPAPSAAQALPSACVRMYRQGLGDCFLLTFVIAGAEKHILIDCGTLGATTTGNSLKQVVADIRATTHDHLDLLIATHEHKDHVSGFGTLTNEFKAMTIDRVWMAWTENPKDPVAQQLAKTKADLGAALSAATAYLQDPRRDSSARAIGLATADILGFSESIDAAMSVVRTGLTVPAEFLNPGDGPLAADWLPGFRIFVLGPPKSHDALFDTGAHGSPELYGLANSLRLAALFLGSGQRFRDYAHGPDAPVDRSTFDAQFPFDARFRYELDSPRVHHFAAAYFAPSEDWRRIDGDWLSIVPELALQLDSATNNTSVALAIERIADGKVLLLPADAQQGNWLSWQDPKLVWDAPDASGNPQRVTASELLRRAVFYKTGHHGSHNGTARGKGLELMESAELTAFIPVDRAVALTRNPQGSWRMPARPLYRRLLEKCAGRVLRSDLGFAAAASGGAAKDTEKEFVGIGTEAEWKAWKAAQDAATHIEVQPLFVQFTLV